jgi:hypothetical protein
METSNAEWIRDFLPKIIKSINNGPFLILFGVLDFLLLLLFILSDINFTHYLFTNKLIGLHQNNSFNAFIFGSTFLSIRILIYFIIITGTYKILSNKYHVLDDNEREITFYTRLGKYPQVLLLIMFLTVCFAAVDMIMILQPGWNSTMWGIYFFIICLLNGIAFSIIVAANELRKQHNPAITQNFMKNSGNLLLGAILFYGYIAYSQYFLSWYANIPIEWQFFSVRSNKAYLPLTLLVLCLRFGIPFLVLIISPLRRNVVVLQVISIMILISGLIDIWLMIVPVL